MLPNLTLHDGTCITHIEGVSGSYVTKFFLFPLMALKPSQIHIKLAEVLDGMFRRARLFLALAGRRGLGSTAS
jgi:hypothetical protein